MTGIPCLWHIVERGALGPFAGFGCAGFRPSGVVEGSCGSAAVPDDPGSVGSLGSIGSLGPQVLVVERHW